MRELIRDLLFCVKFHLGLFLVSLLFRENPKSDRIFNYNIFWWRHIATRRQSWMWHKTTNRPLFNVMEIFPCSDALMAKSLAQLYRSKSVTKKQKHRTSLRCVRSSNLTVLSTEIEYRSAPFFCVFKAFFGYDVLWLRCWGRWKFRVKRRCTTEVKGHDFEIIGGNSGTFRTFIYHETAHDPW